MLRLGGVPSVVPPHWSRLDHVRGVPNEVSSSCKWKDEGIKLTLLTPSCLQFHADLDLCSSSCSGPENGHVLISVFQQVVFNSFIHS